MPEYLAPGVYVEETSFRAKSIEGVGTSTTAFVGPTRKGPFRADTNDQEVPELLTSYGDFERIYGGIADFGFSPATNYLAHAVRAFFNEGGSRLYVSRVVGSGAATAAGAVTAEGTAADEAVAFVARFPGAIGNGRIVVREVLAPVALTAMNNAPAGSLLLTGSGAAAAWHLKIGDTWHPAGSPADAAEDAATLAAATPRMATLLVVAIDGDGEDLSHEGLGFDRSHPAWVGHVMAAAPGRRADHLQNLYAIAIGGNVGALELRNALFAGAGVNAAGELERSFALTGGSDGAAPGTDAYALALGELAGLEDVSIVAAPGSSAYPDAQAVANLLISHAEARRAYRIAVLDLPPAQLPGDARTLRGLIDSRYAAVYYPWVVVSNPLARPGREDIPRELALPPSGFVCGIYARNDVERGVWKAPANEVVRGALRFELDINFAQQEMLNPIGVNCLRYLSGRGFRVWGARLASSDPEWKYVNVRRYFNYLESSIDRGTQWAVFEPNGERLWANVRQTIADFLYNEWRNGALLGTKTEEAFFVRCDRSTMTQNDLDNGRLVCLIGVAVIKPAEFVIFRIGQKTADARA
ncbi:MAG TPA: phage tail sheath subtilisin-like domain-containing protein [Thauera sp.]|uniref:phage tail sheath family protein n=1 Tax=Thauera sp. TaxID=1905334 RepID=UPI000F99B69E|nr:phage tail sheath subtilisin-like domain-containing protein [Thauera sp.]RTL22093.1 MAG: phage tail sheath family protein [Rhodocyclaceae bacterium]HPE04329.1 phage tail sheath subtilisin-like domain-containing protein [Thauera sp.]HRV77667.1 phage tail sheath subtilisin-like domain-containing protein [Thauera sp.]